MTPRNPLTIELQKDPVGFAKTSLFVAPECFFDTITICHVDNAESKKQAAMLRDALVAKINESKIYLQGTSDPNAAANSGALASLLLSWRPPPRLLIGVCDGQSDTFQQLPGSNPSDVVIPVFQKRKFKQLKAPFADPQAAWWLNDISEVVPDILGALGISEDDFKIFLSYKKKDAIAFSQQLFDRLNQEGFDVFLDRFSIGPGIHFQNRLYQELSDKAFFLALETEHYLLNDTPWIEMEIAFAKTHKLALMAVNIDRNVKLKSIDDPYRELVTLDGKGELRQDRLEEIIVRIKERHALALLEKKYNMIADIKAAFALSSVAYDVDSHGFIEVKQQKAIKIFSTPRPAQVMDYFKSYELNPNDKRIILGPKFSEDKRRVLNEWISKRGDTRYYHEFEIADMVHDIVNNKV
ncbi:TIR domain-containing protein [Chryseolinea serpens]|uniref:TIR domain-containing protein n=1 Tax=Chryseolinea serpens TaxID=947013 RepID=A0A1M5VW03_9BACT|nr:toll/interleukin-1 receptor domain-containing protein [Chryseolinea serpens]SHH79391.1 TIR domain-containing protein [Chryseolinea serpens]